MYREILNAFDNDVEFEISVDKHYLAESYIRRDRDRGRYSRLPISRAKTEWARLDNAGRTGHGYRFLTQDPLARYRDREIKRKESLDLERIVIRGLLCDIDDNS